MLTKWLKDVPMLNWKRVSELRDDVGADDFDKIIVLFLEEVDGIIDWFCNGQGFEELDEHLYFFKGSALNIGFSNLYRFAKRAKWHCPKAIKTRLIWLSLSWSMKKFEKRFWLRRPKSLSLKRQTGP